MHRARMAVDARQFLAGSRLQKWMDLSSPPEMIVLLSGVKTRQWIVSGSAIHSRNFLPVAGSQSRIRLLPKEANNLPSGENCTEQKRSVPRHWRGCPPIRAARLEQW